MIPGFSARSAVRVLTLALLLAGSSLLIPVGAAQDADPASPDPAAPVPASPAPAAPAAPAGTAPAIQDTVAAPVADPTPPAGLEVSLIHTASGSTREAMTFSGGSYRRKVVIGYIAVLVRHPKGSLLFDSGFSDQVDAQFQSEMPWWARPFFAYTKASSARAQLEQAGVPLVDRIFLSHGHWDHASALVDFPQAEVWVTQAERDFLKEAGPPAVLPSQVSPPSIRWKIFDFDAKPFGGFDRSLDLFGDGSAVLVPMAGHTPGSTGLYVTLPSGRRLLFVGDTVWNAGAIDASRPKYWLARGLVDDDTAMTLEQVKRLHALKAADPALEIVPAHDGAVHARLGYFPQVMR